MRSAGQGDQVNRRRTRVGLDFVVIATLAGPALAKAGGERRGDAILGQLGTWIEIAETGQPMTGQSITG